MRKILVVATLFLGVLSVQAQEKVMNVQKKDGTSAQTRVAELKQISFLTVDEGGQGLLVKTLGGETAAVLFEAHPVVTIPKMTPNNLSNHKILIALQNRNMIFVMMKHAIKTRINVNANAAIC